MCVYPLSEVNCVANVRDHTVFLPDVAVQPVHPSGPGFDHLLTGLCRCPHICTGESVAWGHKSMCQSNIHRLLLVTMSC